MSQLEVAVITPHQSPYPARTEAYTASCPRVGIWLHFPFAPAQQPLPANYRAGFLAGPRTRPVTTSDLASQRGIGAWLAPPLAHRLLGSAIGDLADVEATTSAAPIFLDVSQRLTAISDTQDAIAAVTAAIAEHTAHVAGPRPEMAMALSLMQRYHGTIPISALSDKVGVSTRTLSTQFRAYTGLSPKLCARVIRIKHAVKLLGHRTYESLAQLAAAAGFSDQAHLCHEMLAFTGHTPSGFLRR